MSADIPTEEDDAEAVRTLLKGKRKKRRAGPKRRTAVKSTLRSSSMFIPNEQTGWSMYDLWVRSILTLYMEYPEVVKPRLNPDGTTALDSFGREYEEADSMMHGIKPGAVWFTRDTMRASWFEIFGTVAYREARETAAAYENDTLEDSRVSYAHPMDTVVGRMKKDGRLIGPHTGRFMLSKEECARLEMPEAWDLHLKRGAKWEGLYYKETVVPSSEVTRKNAVHEHTHVTLRAPHRMMKHSPAFMAWENARILFLQNFLCFDRTTLAAAALSAGIDLQGDDDVRIDSHMTRWAKSGKIRKVLPRLYQAKEFVNWNEARSKLVLPKMPQTSDWLIEWIFLFGPKQVLYPDTYFTTRQVIDYFEELLDQDDEWARQHMPFQFGLNTVSVRLREYIRKGYIFNIGTREKQLSPALVDLFKPMVNKT